MSQFFLDRSFTLELIPDSGTSPVVPDANDQIFDLGSGSITTVGGLNSITTQLTGMTNHAVLVGAGTTTLTKLAVGTDGQVLLGATAADPAFGTLTSPDGSVTFAPGPNALGLSVTTGFFAEEFIPDTGTSPVVPNVSGQVNLSGSGSLETVGSLNTVTFQLFGLTNHALLIGAGTSTITKVGPTATAGQILQSAGSSADPAFSTATYPSTTTVSQILYSSSTNTVAGLATANDGVLVTSNTGVPSILAGPGTTGNILQSNALAAPSFSIATYPSTTAQGDLLLSATANAITALAKDTNATRYLSNTGANNNAAWAQVDLTNGVTGILPLANGGTNANLTANIGGIFYSTATAGAILAGTATANQMLQSGSSAAPAWSTTTWPATSTVNQILFSSATNVVSGLATANRAVLTTGATGTPVLTALATDGQLIIGSTAGVPAAATLTQGTGVTITNASNSITIGVSGAVGQTITGDSGGALSPTLGNWNLLGSGSITTSGSGSTLTTQLTGLTSHAVLIGAGTSTITKVGPSATVGAPLIGAGATADPRYATTFVVNDAGFYAAETATLAGGAVQLGVENLDVVGPGSSARMTVTAHGAGDVYTIYDLDVAGNNYEWGARASDSHFLLTKAANTGLSTLNGTVLIDYDPTPNAGATPSTPSFKFNAPVVILERNAPGQALVLGSWQDDFANSASSAKVESRVIGAVGSVTGDAWMSTVGNLDWSWGEDATTPAVPVFRFGHGGSPKAFSGRFYSITTSGVITFGDDLSPGSFYSFPTADGSAGQVLTTNGAGVLTFQAAGASGWTVIGASQTLAVNQSYMCTTGGALSLALPAVSAVGDTIEIVLDGSTSWTVTQPNAATRIRIGNQQTTLGVGGSLSSTLVGDWIELVCETANARWVCCPKVGNITVV